VEIRVSRCGDRVLVMFIDHTERCELERAYVTAAETERAAIGAALHDDLGQRLTGLNLLAGALAESRDGVDAKARAQLERLSALARDSIDACRNLAHGLAPLTDAHGDLALALRDLAARADRLRPGLRVRYAARRQAPLRITADVRTHLLRIAQEALSNALRHARASRIAVRLSVNADDVRVTVDDDGIGFDPSSPARQGLGLRSQRYRATTIGGLLDVRPRAPCGTVVECRVPNVAATPA
jgi:signal transduction histidine kinase